MDYRSIIASGLDVAGKTSAEVSRQAVGNSYFLYGVLKKGQSPSVDKLIPICAALGLEFYIGPPRGAALESPAHAAPPVERIPEAITDMLGLPEGATADMVVRAMEARLASRGTAQASAAATLDRRTLERTLERTLDSKLKSETRSLENKLAAMLDARLPPAPRPGLVIGNDPEPDTEIRDGPPESQQRTLLAYGADVRAAAGTGEEVFEETEMTVGIPTEALPRGLKPERAIALRAEGHSMEPTIRSGDILVIDHGDREPREGRVCVLRTDTGLVVKRLRREGGGKQGAWIMTSDNAADWPPRPMTEDDRILGHVVWFGPEKAVVVGG